MTPRIVEKDRFSGPKAPPTPSDLDIAQSAELLPITHIAEQLGLRPDELELYGSSKAKVSLKVLDRLQDAPDGKYILVTAITPTPLGEGKTTTAVGLSQAVGRQLGNTRVSYAMLALQQPGDLVRSDAPCDAERREESPSHLVL